MTERAAMIAATEGITCADCIWEALRYASVCDDRGSTSTRVPRHLKRVFIVALHDEVKRCPTGGDNR